MVDMYSQYRSLLISSSFQSTSLMLCGPKTKTDYDPIGFSSQIVHRLFTFHLFKRFFVATLLRLSTNSGTLDNFISDMVTAALQYDLCKPIVYGMSNISCIYVEELDKLNTEYLFSTPVLQHNSAGVNLSHPSPFDYPEIVLNLLLKFIEYLFANRSQSARRY